MDGLRDHRASRYRVSIPTLLPHVEGILFDAFSGPTGDTALRNLVRGNDEIQDSAMASELVAAVMAIWGPLPFSETPQETRRLNRHLILHGRTTGYGTKENSTKLLFALDLVHAVVDHREWAQAWAK
jgi:hypothetical protein